MNWISYLSNAMIPVLFTVIIVYGLRQKTALFDSFIEGAEKGLHIVVDLLPTFVGLFLAVACMRASGLLEWITAFLTPLSNLLHFPSELIPIALTKFVSSSAATGLILDLFATLGPDSLEGRMTAVMIGSTETILYTLSVYFMAVRIKKTRWTLTGAILATLAGIIASAVIVNTM